MTSGQDEPRRRGLLGRVAGAATERVVTSIDPDVILDQVDIANLVDRVDVDRVLDRVDVDALLDRVDVDRVLDRVDVNALLDRVDVNALLDRVDVQRLMARVDLNTLLEDVDLEALVRRSGIPDVVAASTTRMAGSTLDLARRQVAGVDAVVTRMVDRTLHRGRNPAEEGPLRLRHLSAEPTSGARLTVTGHFAGPVSRAVAAVLDILIVTGTYALAVASFGVLQRTFFGGQSIDQGSAIAAVGLAVWGFFYAVTCGVTAGRTLGKGLAGLRLVRDDGAVVPAGRVMVRTLLYPVCAALAGLGFMLIVVQRQRRGLHDLVAGTAVVYDWGERPAELPGPLSAYLARHSTSP